MRGFPRWVRGADFLFFHGFSCFFLFLDRFLSGPFFFCFVGCRVPPGARVHIGAAGWWALWAFDFYLRNDYFFMVRLNGFEQVEKVDFVK